MHCSCQCSYQCISLVCEGTESQGWQGRQTERSSTALFEVAAVCQGGVKGRPWVNTACRFHIVDCPEPHSTRSTHHCLCTFRIRQQVLGRSSSQQLTVGLRAWLAGLRGSFSLLPLVQQPNHPGLRTASKFLDATLAKNRSSDVMNHGCAGGYSLPVQWSDEVVPRVSLDTCRSICANPRKELEQPCACVFACRVLLREPGSSNAGQPQCQPSSSAVRRR